MEASFYPYIAAFVWISLLIVAGVILRAKIKILQTLLFPASLIGGILGFILMRFDLVGIPTSSGWQVLSPSTFGMISFHLFAFSFVGIGLLRNKDAEKRQNREAMRGALWMGLLFGFLFSIQALVGYGAFVGWQKLTGGAFFEVNGFLLGAGFTQGPGQTQAYATVWEESYQVANSIDIGLAFAAIGFLVAGIMGVPFTRYGLRRGWGGQTSGVISPEFCSGILAEGNRPVCAQGTMHPANIDSMGFHLALAGLVYGLAYAFGLLWLNYFPIAGIRGIGLGYTFMWGMMAAMLVRKGMQRLNCAHLLDEGSVRRMTNTCVDFMICAVFMGIKPTALTSVVIPFSVSIVIASFLTLWACLWFGRRAPSLGFARAVTMFGYCTGTGASGLMLLRLVDPEYATPVALEVGLMGLVTFVVFKPISLCMPFAAAPDFPMIWIFVGTAILTPLAMYVLRLVGRRQF